MTNHPPKPRSIIDELPTYKAGRSASPVAGLTPFKLSSNELPFSPPEQLLQVISKVSSNSSRYPDPFSTELTTALAGSLGVHPDMVALGTGGVGVCQQIVQAFCDASDEVVYAWRSFEAYPIICGIAGAHTVPVSLTPEGKHDLRTMRNSVTDRTRMIFICSPNNPTGQVVTHQEFVDFMESIPKDVLVVLDEAYIEFNVDPDVPKSLELLSRFSNLGVLRTFSKAFGLAGLRVGYFIAQPAVIDAVRKTAVPFGVSIIAQAVATEALSMTELFSDRIWQVIQRRGWLENQFNIRGIHLEPSQGNFIWWPLKQRTDEFRDLCEKSALAIRPFSGEGVRVTIGEQEALERLLAVVDDFIRRNPELTHRT